MGYLVIVDRKWGRGEQRREPTPAAATHAELRLAPRQWHRRFTIENHQPGVKTVFKPNPNWWRKAEHNLKEIIFTPIARCHARRGPAVG